MEYSLESADRISLVREYLDEYFISLRSDF